MLLPGLLQISELLRSNPKAAAEKVRQMGHKLLELADRLERGNPWEASTRTGDRVRFKVQGPNGHTKQESDWIS